MCVVASRRRVSWHARYALLFSAACEGAALCSLLFSQPAVKAFNINALVRQSFTRPHSRTALMATYYIQRDSNFRRDVYFEEFREVVKLLQEHKADHLVKDSNGLLLDDLLVSCIHGVFAYGGADV